MRKSRNQFCGIALVVVILFTSCTTYHLSVNDLFSQLDSTSTQGKGFLSSNAIRGNTLTSIKCYDKTGKEHMIPVTPHTAVRISKTDKKRVQLYFDTITLKDSTITGSKSHFFNIPITPIRFHEVLKIELQK